MMRLDTEDIKRQSCTCASLIKHQAMKTWGSGGIRSSMILDLGNSWMSVVSFTPLSLCPRGQKIHTHWIGGWVGPRAGLDDVGKRKILPLPGIEPTVQPIIRRYIDWTVAVTIYRRNWTEILSRIIAATIWSILLLGPTIRTVPNLRQKGGQQSRSHRGHAT
jgi:hypothetical protein